MGWIIFLFIAAAAFFVGRQLLRRIMRHRMRQQYRALSYRDREIARLKSLTHDKY